MPPKGYATKGGAKMTKRPTQPTKPATSSTGLWQQSLQPRPSQDFTLCAAGRYLDWSTEMRHQHETLFTMPVNIKLFGSWTRSEDYWYRKDKEMLEYLQDFPVSKWLIDQAEARATYAAMQARFRSRDEGRSVYWNGIPEYWPYGKPAADTPLNTDGTNTAQPPDTAVVKAHQGKQPRKSGPMQASLVEATLPDSTSLNGVKKVTAVAEKVLRKPATVSTISTKPALEPQVTTKKPRKSATGLAPPAQLDGINETRSRRGTRVSQANIVDLTHEPQTLPTLSGDAVTHPELNPRKRKAKSIQEKPPAEVMIDTPLHTAVDPEGSGHEASEVTLEPPAKKRKIEDTVPKADHNEKCEPKVKQPKKAATPPPFDRDPNVPQQQPTFDFPWQNDWAGDDPEEWDDGIYDPTRLAHLHQIHKRNAKIVTKYMENGKHGAQKRKSAAIVEGMKNDREEEDTIIVGEAKIGAIKPHKKRPKLKRSRGADQREHFSGRLDFADDQQVAKFRALNYPTIEDAIKAAMINPFDESLKDIEVAYDPGDSLLDNLHLPRISIMDIARTRLQLHHIRIFTNRAAERLIDFCPDLLTNYMLLQVVSETSYGNTQVQIRLGQNGSMLSDSTITKRVSAALSREYDRSGAAEAAKKDPDFRKTNRDMYSKYKAWRAQRRQVTFEKVSKFILIDSAKQHKRRLEAEESNEHNIDKGKTASKLRPIEPASPTPSDYMMTLDEPNPDADNQDGEPPKSAPDPFLKALMGRIQSSRVYVEDSKEIVPEPAAANEPAHDTVEDITPSIESAAISRPKLKLKKPARNSWLGPRVEGQRTMEDYYGSRVVRTSNRRNTHQSYADLEDHHGETE